MEKNLMSVVFLIVIFTSVIGLFFWKRKKAKEFTLRSRRYSLPRFSLWQFFKDVHDNAKQRTKARKKYEKYLRDNRYE